MTGDPKKTRPEFEGVQLHPGRNKRRSGIRLRSLITNSHTLIPLLSGVIQVISGLTLVCITILGLIPLLWVAAVVSLMGCILSMMGGFLIYQTATKEGSFDSLLNQAIRRVIKSQN